MSDYPAPKGALMIWRAGDQLMVRIPPSAGHDRGHVINFPFETAGVQTLKMLLTQRECEDGKIGARSAPTQDMADAWLQAMKAGKSVTKITTRDREAERRQRIAKQAEVNIIDLDDLLGDL